MIDSTWSFKDNKEQYIIIDRTVDLSYKIIIHIDRQGNVEVIKGTDSDTIKKHVLQMMKEYKKNEDWQLLDLVYALIDSDRKWTSNVSNRMGVHCQFCDYHYETDDYSAYLNLAESDECPHCKGKLSAYTIDPSAV